MSKKVSDRFELDEVFHIYRDGFNFVLVQKIESYAWNKEKTAKVKGIKDKPSYHGTLYQALQAYLNRKVDGASDLSEVRKKAAATLRSIDLMMEDIRDNFKDIKTQRD
jgi:hypothetical protein